MGGNERAWHPVWRPMVLLADVTTLIHIVGIGHHRVTPQVIEAQQEATTQPPLVGATSRLHIGDVALRIGILQIHIHNVFPVFHIIAQHLAFVRLLLIDFQVFDRVVGQILH